MLTVWNYVSGFVSVVLFNCVQPVNWSYCLAVNEWVPPYFGDLKRFYCERPYESEHVYLDKF